MPLRLVQLWYSAFREIAENKLTGTVPGTLTSLTSLTQLCEAYIVEHATPPAAWEFLVRWLMLTKARGMCTTGDPPTTQVFQLKPALCI